MADPIISEPTLYTGRRVAICLLIAIVFIILSGIVINYNLYLLYVICISVVLIMVSIICCQPSRQSGQKISIWMSTLYLILSSTLISNFSLHIVLTIVTWTIFCGVAWFMYNPASNNLMKQMKQMFHAKRRFSHSSRHSSSAVTLVDTIHIVR